MWRTTLILISSFATIGVVAVAATAQTNADQIVVVVSAWKIQVVDPSGKPLRKVFVRQVWRDYDMEDADHESDSYTDRNGFVSFPERRGPKVSDALRRENQLKHVQETGVHTSFGVHAYVLAWGKIVGCKRLEGNADYMPGKPLPTKLHTSIAILPGFKCRA
jgi:hypothetical protein